MAEYINPRVDWAFKRIFGSDDTKECLITFLNGVFEDEFVIKDVKHLKTEQTRHQKRERGVIFDVACETSDGRHVIVEMQKKEQRYFVDRALYYSSKAIVEQAKPGEWDFHLTPVYTVCFMDFIAETGIPCQFRTDIGLGLLEDDVSSDEEPCKRKASKTKKTKVWQLSGLRYGFEKMRVVFLQLPLFEKKEPECMDLFDCWIYVLNNMEHLKEIPFLDKYPVFRKLAAIGDLRKLTPEEREYYEEDVKIMRDLYATDKWEKEKRRMEREAARKEVEAVRRELDATCGELEDTRGKLEDTRGELEDTRGELEDTRGELEAARREKEAAVDNTKLAIAQKLLSLELPLSQIMKATGLTQEQIQGLQK